VVCLLTVLFPLGTLSFAHPLLGLGAVSHGLLPPWAGLILVLLAPGILSLAARGACAASGILVMASVTGFVVLPSAAAPDWAGLAASMTEAPVSTEQMLALMALSARIHRHPARFVLTPEGIAGRWQGFYNRLFDSAGLRAQGRGAWIGAERWAANGQGYDNVLIGLGVFEGKVLRQGLPVPGALWRPGSPTSARAYLWPGVITHPRLSALVCYEQLLLWSYVAAVWQQAGQPFVLLAPNALGWDRSGAMRRLQHTALALGARLVGVPRVVALGGTR